MEVNRHLHYYKPLWNIAVFVLRVLGSCAPHSVGIIWERRQLPEMESPWDEDVGLAEERCRWWESCGRARATSQRGRAGTASSQGLLEPVPLIMEQTAAKEPLPEKGNLPVAASEQP